MDKKTGEFVTTGRRADTPCDVKNIDTGEEQDFPLRSLVGGVQHLIQLCRLDV